MLRHVVTWPQRDGRCYIEAFIVTAFTALVGAIVALGGVVGYLYREVRKVVRAEADCRVKLAELREQLAALGKKGDQRQRENRNRLRRIERKDRDDPGGDTPCPTR